MKFNWDLIMQPRTVVHCDTEDKANELLTEAHKRGLKWSNGNKYTEYNGFNVHESKTCYDFNNNDYGSYGHCKKFNYTILSFYDILIKKENKMKIKYDLQVFHNLVLFKVLEMDEKYRHTAGDCTGTEIYTSSNGIIIASSSNPTISSRFNTVYVLGENKFNDNFVTTIKFDTVLKAQEYANKVRFALEEWNNHTEIIEIEYYYEYFNCKKIFTNLNHSLHFTKNPYYTQITIYMNDSFVNSYITNSRHIPLDKTIIMFNRDCELLNIPFRIKGDN